MRILAIETATDVLSVALFDGGNIVAWAHREPGRGHAEQLVPAIAALPERGRADRILVSLGPGSFTGVRIGLAAARALGLAWGAQVVGFSTLALVAATLRGSCDKPVTVCMKAGHGEWLLQSFAANGEPYGPFSSVRPERAVHWLKTAPRNLVGDRAEVTAQLVPGARPCGGGPDARFALELHDAALCTELRPLYARAPDAVVSATLSA